MRIIVNNINPTELHDELLNNGITPLLVESTPYTDEDKNAIRPDTWVTVDDTQAEATQSIIDAFVAA